MRKLLLPTLLLVLLIGGFIAWAATRPATGGDDEQEAVCALVIDRTASFADNTVEESRRTMARSAVDGCKKRKARLMMFYFDQSTQKLVVLEGEDGRTSFELWLPEGQKKGVQERELDETVEMAHAAAESAFDRPSGDGRGSDIATAVRAAAADLNVRANDDEVDDRFLIVISDGLQTSAGLTVQDLASPDAPVEPLVAKVEELGLTPDLDGVNVSFVGIRSGVTPDGGQLEEYFEAKVEEFWRAVVAQGGGSMCVYETTQTEIPAAC